MEQFISKLGEVFEGAFKSGLLQIVKPEEATAFHTNFVEGLSLPEGYRKLLLSLEEQRERIGTFLGEDVESFNEKLLMTVYLLGLYAGRLYGENHKNMELVKYHMGEGSSEAGKWQNADLIFKENGTLYVVDFKLLNASYWIREYFQKCFQEEDELPYIPAVNSGVPVNISLGELSFVSFVENFLQVQEYLLELQDILIEIKGLSQVLSYAVDYLCDQGDAGLREVCLELIYPIPESYRARFYIKEGDAKLLEKYREEVRALYEELRKKESELKELAGAKDSVVRTRRLKDKYINGIKYLEEELKKIEQESVRIQTEPISVPREDVERRIKEFMKRREQACAIALLHSAGSGKTSRAREAILSQEGKHIVLYFASRIILLEREKDVLQSMKRDDLKVIYVRDSDQKSNKYEHTGRAYRQVGNSAGKLLLTVEEIDKVVKREGGHYRWIWALTTTQAFVEHDKGETSRHLEKLLGYSIIRDYTIHVIVDEFFGYKNGLYVLEKVFEFARKVKEKGGRIKLYLFDANGYSPHLLEKLLREYGEYGVVPDSMVLCDYTEEKSLYYKGIPLELYAKHGYPSENLLLERKFLFVEKENELAEKIAQYVLSTYEDRNYTAFLYVQDKELIVELSKHFKKEGLSTTIVTASSRKSQKEINEGDSHIILGTSSVSRGVDFSRPHKPIKYIYVVVFDWGVEQNMVEVLQAISRARGDERTEKEEKHLHLVFPIEKASSYTVENLRELLEVPDRELVEVFYRYESLRQKALLAQVATRIVEYFLRKPSGKVLVPVPAQHRSVYKSNRISDLESIVTFLDDIYVMELAINPHTAIKIKRLLEELMRSITLSAIFDERSISRYYHPYLLLESTPLKLSFSSEGREKVKKLYREVEKTLKEHNEEKAKDIEEFLNNTASIEEYRVTFLLPVYSLVFVKRILKEGQVMRFRLRKRVGRGGATSLGSELDLITRCHVPALEGGSGTEEYAGIPLGEDYPYLEVLSGRFAKFPVEFVSKLLEGQS